MGTPCIDGITEYQARKLRAVKTRCQHIAGMIQRASGMGLSSAWGSSSAVSGGSNLTPFEHHAIRAVCGNYVIHYASSVEDDDLCVRVMSWSEFTEIWPQWRVVQMPFSLEHADCILERARAKIGEVEYNLFMNNCEHFANWCFRDEPESSQVQVAVGTVVGSGVVAASSGIAASLAASTMTTAVNTTIMTPVIDPCPFISFIMGHASWNSVMQTTFATSTTTVTSTAPAYSPVLAAGISAGAAVGAGVVSLASTYGAYKWIEYGKSKVARRLPICIVNQSKNQIRASLKNVDSIVAVEIDDIVHDARAYFGVGVRSISLGPDMDGELNPAAEEEFFHRFELTVEWRDESQIEQSITEEVHRGDVFVWRCTDCRLLLVSVAAHPPFP